MKVTLSGQERDLLVSFVSQSLAEIIAAAPPAGSKCGVDVTDEVADEIRDACNDELVRAGFDETYQLTSTGVTLQTLVDKFFAG